MKRRQFPITLAFAMTINKRQGQTFDRVGLLLTSQVFSHGQLYVAMSRVRRSDALKILSSDPTTAKNVVYKEVLL
jgi:ATP-dependent exoDNAse (exonuclease V) alpha subunit